jgi:hypothetical protein
MYNSYIRNLKYSVLLYQWNITQQNYHYHCCFYRHHHSLFLTSTSNEINCNSFLSRIFISFLLSVVSLYLAMILLRSHLSGKRFQRQV